MNNKITLDGFINNVHAMEREFHSSLELVNLTQDENLNSLNELISEGLEYNAANVITQRMFIYHMERNMLDHVEKSKRIANVTLHCNHINAFLNNINGRYRDFVVFEIKNLIGDNDFSIEGIEKEFIIENTKIMITIITNLMASEHGKVIDLNSFNIKDIETYLFMNVGLKKIDALKFCLAAMVRSYEGPNADLDDYLPKIHSESFDDFYFWMLDNHLNSDEFFMLVLSLMTFVKIFQMY